ncbi:dethiobiotin synthase [Campylobacter sp. LH-2024]|uniref:dethiobiotin synthase n=1 Tax=Campylobacter TaxID=194 RepID=UPI001D4ACA83|nr:dethiobiotin synthase [Campylobacter sp. RM10542]MBZ7940036.1 dethiobiotin synthase [Campylobacter sp. W0047]MBZ7945013.1 dethiobiotin synthase [Campylobacter sp. RM10532]MBZ7946162.1 dethiobiotin synthase [Campylobacter sp. RM10536]MBZ7948024.1 dethiobiotin synthase [Campylobacter sp. RM9929]MBZ7950693.1 dethiobiotin synthase [Campylobacter sp. W0046]MBZ7955763.1 dethiobiotin synthase [Campylobacter sp. RM17709]MBZ7956866.1 dethiobiotin synthase [Campylobacter sp. RM10541]MBZ7968406.1 d
MQIYISGIHTDVGKTYLSARICKELGFDYFKLIQAGTPKDSDIIAQFSPKTKIFKEGIFLQTPVSPHKARTLEGLNYKAFDIALPQSDKLIIELAGGLFSPIDDEKTMIDFMQKFKRPTILVAKDYLGSINHTLLSIEALKQKDIPILALVLKSEDHFSKDFISKYTQIPIIDFNDRVCEKLSKIIKNLL